MSTPLETFEKGVKYRLAGNEAFVKQDYKEALKQYYNALLHFKTVGGQKLKEEYKERSDAQLVMVYNNMTAVFAKQDRWDRVLFYAQKAHEIDNKNAKAKFRLGQAYIRTDKFAEAKVLLEEVLAENPDDALVKQELNKVNTANKAIEAKEKMIYKAMMTKFFPEQT